MSGLLDSLSIATTGLTAARTGLDVTGQNIANVNTPGYARRTLALAELPPTDLPGAGSGVTVLQIQALRDLAIEGRIGHEQAGQSHDSALLGGLTEVESAIGTPGSSLDANISALFDAFSQLANDPTSASARDSLVRQGQTLAQGFNALSARIAELGRATDASLKDSVGQLNALTATVADLNGQIAVGGANMQALIDQRSATISTISQLADVSVLQRADGAVDLSLPNGQALVVGANTYAIQTVSGPPSGFSSLTLSDIDITSQLKGGRLGGLLQLRDTALPGYQSGLDHLAYDIATQVNAVHSTGYDGTGTAAGNFFAPPATVAGAAASLAVDPAVVANSQLVAASSTGALGDNGTAQALAGLRDTRVMSGGTQTASEAWSSLVYRVGSDVATASAANATRGSVVRQLQRLRDQTSGVSLDEEAANLMKFQRAYEASARFFTTVNTTLDALMVMVP